MSNTKISALTAYSAAMASGDLIPFVDISDTTQAASGTTKKITAAYLAQTDGTVATITGGGTLALAGFTFTVPATGTAAIRAADNAFSVAQTINGFQVGGSTAPAIYQVATGHTGVRATQMTLANNGTYVFTAGTISFAFIYNASSGRGSVFIFRGGFNAMDTISLGTGFSVTKDNAATLNVYVDSGSYTVQNKTGGSILVFVQTVGI